MKKLNPNDYIGQIFGKLTILEYAGYKNNYHYFNAVCDCEYKTIKKYRLSDLKDKKRGTKTCGVCNKGTHNKSHTKLYNVWKGMRSRCNNKNAPEYHCYGGKGIRLCSEWQDNFASFYDWAMGNGYKEGLEVDRINVNGNYEPTNCQFLTKSQNVTKGNLERIYSGNRIVSGINEQGEEFVITNVRDFARQYNLDASAIIKTCKGYYKHHKKWNFTYID